MIDVLDLKPFGPLEILVPIEHQQLDEWETKNHANKPVFVPSIEVFNWLQNNRIKTSHRIEPVFLKETTAGERVIITKAFVTIISFSDAKALMLFKLTFQ